ncbi:MAG: tRNA 4-thiouridine(8) synthase ThiI [Oscillospiraceae bacterium]|nr:tRNA 4-thiouridine(8) synthase ThiI [Oscillospiraceae bacterium]
MKEVILIKNGEIALKGLNRNVFEDILIKNIKSRLSELGEIKYSKAQSTIYIEPMTDNINISNIISRLKKVFGIAGICRTYSSVKNIDEIKKTALEYLKNELSFIKTFKIESKRSDKKFIYKSPEISRIVGEYLLNNKKDLSVDVHNPEAIINIEVRDFGSYIYAEQLKGIGGLPTGSSGKAMLMISGGIDSPVAGYMMAKRGLELCGTHFVSPPFTSEKAKLKVIDLLKKLSEFSGNIKTYIINFTEFQEAIKKHCPNELFTVIMRRYMLKIAEITASDSGCPVVVTGESLAQVASQTLPALICTESVATRPVLRPLIGLDKLEIINIAKQIDTYDISILPFEDCCTVFTPKHPKTRPTIEEILIAEEKIKSLEKSLLEKIWSSIEIININ